MAEEHDVSIGPTQTRPIKMVSDVMRSIANLPRKDARANYRTYFHSRIAWTMFSLIHLAYDVKSHGGADDLGNDWAPLSPSTLKWKRRKHPRTEPKILIDEGHLHRSLEPTTMNFQWKYRARKNQIFETTPMGMSIGTSDPKAIFHQKGTVRMPARPPIPENTRPWLVRAVFIAANAVVRRVAERIK